MTNSHHSSHRRSLSRDSATRFTVRGPEDYVAFVPQALGFIPDTSVVMLTFPGPGTASFHARIDLPVGETAVEESIEVLLRAARRHRVAAAAFLLYERGGVEGSDRVESVAWSLRDGFTDAGITVLDILRVTPERWFAVLPGHPAEHYTGVVYDLASHRFTVQGVLAGRVTRTSREELKSTLEPDAGSVARTAQALPTARAMTPDDLTDLVMEHLAGRTSFSTSDLARVARTIATGHGRDAAWGWLAREDAGECAELWSDAVRRLPEPEVAPAAAVLAFVAWLAGDGALAWCAVDRCRAVQPDNTLATLVADLLHSATSPDSWAVVRDHVEVPGDPAA